MTDLGVMSYFLGMEIDQDVHGIFVNQRKYANEVLKKFCMENCKPVNLPLIPNLKLSKDDDGEKVDEELYRSLIGCLLYLTTTRPVSIGDEGQCSKFGESDKADGNRNQ
ncbi:uncharacterized protein LOC116134356 [Pistacia vera]|uniref:uncharacterized protein LOC116134356 n=1 Tax=Pistacia vera TaxID=55513 RepID=UPI001263C542|nr:uncharacterized protein LOC116134356 [Pistacia vera]